MIKSCKQCDKEYKIIPQEEEFYNKIKFDLPKMCPACRQKRRLSFKNSRELNKQRCDKCNTEIITTHPKDFQGKIYCSKCFEENFG